MSMYLIFFGKSQDFSTRYYDRENSIDDFNSVIKDFDLLESKVFTVDDIKNKEILSRYFFNLKGRNFCLLKLYSFAQAFSGNRIAGSIYGVGLLSDRCIQFTKDNLELLRAAKQKFAELSLDGAKFKKSDFQEDTDRIWKAIVTSNNGNLLEKVTTSTLSINKTESQVAFYVKDLFGDAIKLNNRISNQDIVYLSEDLEHLKRTQNKWGKDNFPVYWEKNNEFVIYKDEPPTMPTPQHKDQHVSSSAKSREDEDILKLRSELADFQYNNQHLQQSLDRVKGKLKVFKNIVYGLLGLIILLLLYVVLFTGDLATKKKDTQAAPPPAPVETASSINISIADTASIDSGVSFLTAVQFIYSFDPKNQIRDTIKFYDKMKIVDRISGMNKYSVEAVKSVYVSKCEEVKIIASRIKSAKTVEKKVVKKPI